MSYFKGGREILLPAGVKLKVKKVKKYYHEEKEYEGHRIKAIIYFETRSGWYLLDLFHLNFLLFSVNPLRNYLFIFATWRLFIREKSY